MRRLLKWAAIVIAVVVVLAVGAIVAALVFVDPNDYRDDIAAAVERSTGRSLTIDGDLSLTFLPRVGVTATDVRLADAPGFGDKPFASAAEATLAVALWPLISGDLRLDTIVLREPRIRLIRNEQGEANWEQFSPTQNSEAATQARDEPPKPAEQPSGGQSPLPAIVRNARLAGVRVIDARVRFHDRAAGTDLTVEPLDITLDDVRFGAPVPLEASWEAQLAGGPAVAGTLEASVQADSALTTARADDIALEVTASGERVPAGELSVSAEAALAADLAEGVYRLQDVLIEAAGSRLEGQAEARTTEQGLVATGTLTLPETNPREVMEALAIEPPETRDSEVLTRLTAQTDLRYEDGVLRAEPLTVTLDDSKLEGSASLRDFAAPAVAFDLAVDRVNADRYLPPESQTGESTETSAGKGGSGGESTSQKAGTGGQIPVETLRTLDVDGRLTVGELTVSGMQMSDVEVVVKGAEGKLRAHPLTASLYGGSYQGDVRIDATGDQPVVRVDEQLSGVKAGPLLTDMAGFEKLLGTANVSLAASSRGANTQALLKALDGEARFEFLEGAYKGVNVAQMLRQAMARLRGGSVASSDAPQKTDFSSVIGTLQFDGPVARNQDLEVKTPLLRITGGGQANLLERNLDYNLTVNVVDTLKGQGGQSLGELRRVPVPLRVRGPFADPSIELAVGEALKGAFEDKAKARIEEKSGELKEKLRGKLREELGGGGQSSSDKQDGTQSEKSTDAEQDAEEKLKGELKGLFGE